MNKRIIISIILLITIVILSIFISNTIKLNNLNNDYYYKIENETVPSIYNIVGNRKINTFKSTKKDNIYNNTYSYKNIKNVSSDLSKYTLELKDNYNYIYTSDIDFNKKSDNISLARELDKDEVIIIKIKYNSNSYNISIYKGKGNISIY